MACFDLLMLLQLFIVLSGVFHSSRIVCGQNFTLEPKNLLPCQVETSTVSLNQSDVLAIQADLRLCSSSWIKNNYNVSHWHTLHGKCILSIGSRIGEYCSESLREENENE